MDDDDLKHSKPVEQDVVLLHGPTEDGAGYRGLRARDGQLELAELRPAKDGQPLAGSELVTLHPRAQFPLLCDVEVLYRRPEPPEAGKAEAGPEHAGPARVTSRSYRAHWDQTFGPGRQRKREPAN